MSHRPSDSDTRQPIDVLDFSSIFIAREQQLDLFDVYLSRWKRLMGSATTQADTQVAAAPSPNNPMQSFLVLLYGRGGFGKSNLLKHYRRHLERDRPDFFREYARPLLEKYGV